ncbi:permease for cytosine/purines, uracil, thiamine, allantoin-domain-containing protein [Aspergillus pseudonomiae]|uniref:Permease for cytosine/purines, uracil, thiamine, allantoin-domain-containing protein n=1 Tax=Aspergillus pseudonomiae TaxID=1506151 RepID=A0A5N7DFD5_9EURO|nr:permease for cytosine/purines, uracil, thiamine, allantoin-domain-containing protein [Aspergillus pseudonomiae]KAE8404974.1 permease for cytosine/purines, uracil, thiamine, allantoin-domain-containing protein [Aspergillus pseudonomiae]
MEQISDTHCKSSVSIDGDEKTNSTWIQALSIEKGGIERVTPDQRQENVTHFWNACTFWLSANMAVATLTTGALGGPMGLKFWDSFIVILVVNLISDLLPAWTAAFGLTGLRMTTFSRYSFGYWGNLLVVVFSMVATTGWNAINSISGAAVLNALSDGRCPTWAGVIIICTVVWIVCVLGINWIHKIDTFIWIPPLIVWCVTAGTGASQFSSAEPKEFKSSQDRAAAILSFMAIIFSFSVSWVNCAADYNVRMPINTSRARIFGATYIGIFIPSVLVQTLGAALFSGTVHNPEWKAAYASAGVGGLLKMALEPAGGFGKFLMVLAALSSIPNNIPNNYSFALHAQNFGPWALRIPRIALVTFGFIVSLVVGCCAAQFFKDTLQTFLSVIGYWTVIHIVIVAEEHLVFRRGWQSYDLDAWDDPAKMHFGWSAIGAFGAGFVGAALGMKVAWYVGPIAGLIGSGANVGHELTGAFSGIMFLGLRWAERRVCGM